MRVKAFGIAIVAALLASASALAMATGGGRPQLPDAGDDYGLAQQLVQRQEFAAAIPHLESALKLHPKNADILNDLGYAHRMVGAGEQGDARDKDFAQSLDFYQQALALDPNHRGVHEYLGELYLQMNKPDEAKHELEVLTTLCPDGCPERDTLAKAIAGKRTDGW